jgi:putative hydrolase of the HAD superfamily
MVRSPVPKAIFFDLDETLIRHDTPVTELFQAACRRHLAEPAGPRWDRFHQHLRSQAGQLWQDIAAHQGRGEAAFLAMFRSSLAHTDDDPALAEPIVEAFVAAVIESTGPTEGAHAVLDRLAASGIPTGIITNGFSFLQKRKALAHGLTERVRFVLTSEDVGAHKPDTRIFQRALEQIGVDAHDCWHVGDHRNNDIEGALNAGLGAVWYTPEPGPADTAPDASSPDLLPYRVITRLTDIPALIARFRSGI